LPLFPGPKSGSPKATAGSASIPTDAAIAASFLIAFHLRSLVPWSTINYQEPASETGDASKRHGDALLGYEFSSI